MREKLGKNLHEFYSQAARIWGHNFVITLSLGLVKFGMCLYTSAVTGYHTGKLKYQNYGGWTRGLMVMSTYVSLAICSGFFGHFSEWTRAGRNFICTLGLFTLGACNIIFAFCENIFALEASLLLAGAGVSAIYTTVNSIIVDFFPEKDFAFATSSVEMFEAICWAVGPVFIGALVGNSNRYLTAFATIGSIQICIAAISCLAFYLRLKPRTHSKNNSIDLEKNIRTQNKPLIHNLREKLLLLLTTRMTWVCFISNLTGCISTYGFSTAIALTVKDGFTKSIYLSCLAGPFALIVIPFIDGFARKDLYIIGSNMTLAAFFFFLGDFPVDKSDLNMEAYRGVMLALFFARDFMYYITWVYCNMALQSEISYRYPQQEMNGLVCAVFVVALGVGDSLGVLAANVVHDYTEYAKYIALGSAVLMMGSFVVTVLIRFCRWK